MQSNIFPGNTTITVRKSTANATPTTVKSFSVSEGQTVKIYADVTAMKADGSEIGGLDLYAMFYRQAAGDVTKQGYTDGLPVNKTAGTTIDVEFVANTVSQQIDVKVTGITATTVKWLINIKKEILS